MSGKATQSLHERAYEAILADILEGRLGPGNPVDRKAVAHRLEISLAPVHMAVNQLESDGFVVTLPRRGTHVRGYRPEDIRGHTVVRMALEAQAARMYAGNTIAAARNPLLKGARLAQKVNQPDLDRIRADVAFHRSLVELAGIALLTAQFTRVMNVGLFLGSCGVHPMANKPWDNHVQLVEDLCAATPLQADARIRMHIRQKGKKSP